LQNFTYDYSFGDYSHSILGIILKSTVVCDGISKFVKFALDYLGVKCIVVFGKGLNPLTGKAEKHAWNIVKLEGNAYHLVRKAKPSVGRGTITTSTVNTFS